MLRLNFQRAFAQSIAFAVLVFSLNAFGQNVLSSKCAGNDYECFIGEYTAIINANPTNSENYLSRAGFYIKLKRFDAALQDYDKAITLNPKSNLGYIGRGYVYQLQGRYLEAVIELNKALKIDPKDSYALDLHRYSLAWVGKSSSAIDDYGRLIEIDPNNAEYYYLRGKKYFQFKNFIQAADDASKAFEIDPKYTAALGVRSDSYCKIGKWKEATADIKTYEHLTGKPSGAVCLINLFLSLKNCVNDDTECRMDVYNSGINNPGLIERSPGVGDFYAGRGIIYYLRGDFEHAFKDFDSADKYVYEYKDDSIEIYLGKKAFAKGLYDEALTHFMWAEKKRKDSDEAYLGIGEIYLIKREYEKALDNYEKAIFLNPRLSKAYLGRGTVYLEYGKNYREFENNEAKAIEAYKNAVKNFDSVIDLDLKDINPEVYLRRSKAYEKLGEAEKAENDRAKYQELSAKP